MTAALVLTDGRFVRSVVVEASSTSLAMVMSRIARIARHCLTRRRHLNTRRVAVATIHRATAYVVLR